MLYNFKLTNNMKIRFKSITFTLTIKLVIKYNLFNQFYIIIEIYK